MSKAIRQPFRATFHHIVIIIHSHYDYSGCSVPEVYHRFFRIYQSYERC